MLCMGAFILVVFWAAFVFFLICYSLLSSDLSDVNTPAVFAYPLVFLLYMGSASLIPLILWRMLKEISDARTPFTLKNAKRLRVLALILLVYDILAFLMDVFASQFLLQSNGLSIFIGEAISDFASNSTATLDLFPLVIAAVFFALSYVFKYGVLLQQESDETL